MDPKVVKTELKKLVEKYQLPELELLDRELELVDLLSERRELPQDLLAIVRRRFTEVLYSWINLLHSLVVPNPQSIIVNKDSEAFSEKDIIYSIMAELAKMTRESTRFEASRDIQKEEAKFISENFNRYMDLKKELAEINSKIVEHWQKEVNASRKPKPFS